MYIHLQLVHCTFICSSFLTSSPNFLTPLFSHHIIHHSLHYSYPSSAEGEVVPRDARLFAASTATGTFRVEEVGAKHLSTIVFFTFLTHITTFSLFYLAGG